MLELVCRGRRYSIDESAYDRAGSESRASLNRSLASLIGQICESSPRQIFSAMASISRGRSQLRYRAAVLLMKWLLADSPRPSPNSRVALLTLFLGLMDTGQGRDSSFHQFLRCVMGETPDERRSTSGPAGLRQILSRLLVNESVLCDLSPETVAVAIGFARLSGQRPGTPRLWKLRVADRPPYRDVSWVLALRFGLLLSEQSDAAGPFESDLIRAVIGRALAVAHRGPGVGKPQLVERAERASPVYAAIRLLVEFEADPIETRLRYADRPYEFRSVRSAEPTDVVMDSDGSEIIGYLRDQSTGEVVGIERTEVTAPLRGSRNRYRWNNEPVRRMRLVDGTISPNGLVLIGDDEILDAEFANIPNRSGTAFDRHHVASYRELVLADDKTAMVRKFPKIDISAGVLLCGMSNMGNYGHFILNGVSKLPVIRSQYGSDWQIIVPAEMAPFHHAIVEYCNFDPTRLVFTGNRRGVRSARLDVIAEAPHGTVPFNLLSALRASLPRPPRRDGPRRLYLSRPEGFRRTLANEPAVLDMLSGLGFDVLRPEEMPFAEQVAALEAADVIVAPHGSALHTLMFCFGSKRIVEIATKLGIWMSQYAFLGHEAVRLPTTRTHTAGQYTVEDTEYAVDLDQLRAAATWAVSA